jgi:tetrahydromethanopterin S-methyltransferase subunit C
MMEPFMFFGTIGAVAFALCGAPQAWKCYKQGHGDGLSFGFMGLWALGTLATICYAALLPGATLASKMPLFFNYAGNVAMISVIFRYMLFPRRKKLGR